jgi:hypothetical protein
MREILPGLYHWTAHHPNIGAEVSCYYAEPTATVIDPLEPAEGLDWFADRPVERVVLTNRHHFRHADRFHERFGVPILVHERGLHEVEGKPGVTAFAFGAEVAPGVTAHGVIDEWPDEGTLLLDLGPGVLAIADGAIRYGGELGFVPDQYLGDDPDHDKRLLRAGYRRLADELEFDALLFAHGDPLLEGGRDALRAFAAG